MRIEVQERPVRALLQRLLEAGLRAVDPHSAIRACVTRRGRHMRVGTRRYDLGSYRSICVVGAGKASGKMAAGLEGILGRFLTQGLVVVPYGHRVSTKRIELVEARHPIPDRAGARAAARVVRLAGELTAHDLLIVLVSGGASSLLPLPAPGLTLQDKQFVTTRLLRTGADIHEVNTVRKHLSAIKGGRLAAGCRAPIVTLLLSDVVGGDLATIGGGLTAPDPTTYADAIGILRRYGLWPWLPPVVRRHLHGGRQGRVPETPKPGTSGFGRVCSCVIGDNGRAITAIAHEARRAGLRSVILTTSLTGEAREIAKLFGAIAREVARSDRPARRPLCVLAGGELTVTVRGEGRGGRAQEFALAAAREIGGLPDVWIGGCGTDGMDGPTEMAGAVVSGATQATATRRGIDLERALQRNDSYEVFERIGGHVYTGRTGTNVGDLYFLLAR
jgi:glycerate 2-kinase